AFAVDSGVPAEDAERAITAISAQLPVLSPEQDAALMQDAGFEDVALFYAGFSFKGWVGYKPR
ncbi:methyltransferase, partial [Klebsiella pneumoniae]|nr:methyltransferase [Klebsiella pneumoniae]